MVRVPSVRVAMLNIAADADTVHDLRVTKQVNYRLHNYHYLCSYIAIRIDGNVHQYFKLIKTINNSSPTT